MESKITPVILAGGSGARLWPVSRDSMPKQFLPLVGELSTYQQALERLDDPDLFASPIVVTSDAFRFFAARQANELAVQPTVVLEPTRRDSAPAIAAGALVALQHDPNAVVLVAAADHVILDRAEFHVACRRALDAALRGKIVTFGIRPFEPKTSYGYIKPGPPLDVDGVKAVAAFVEKPDVAAAQTYILDGYLWNSGNFMARADVLLAELACFEPEMHNAVEAAVAGATTDLGFIRLAPGAFAAAPAKSFDYAVMERTDKAAIVEGRFRWSDIGSWDAVLDVSERDASGNSVRGPSLLLETRDCVVHSEDRLSVLLGVKDLIVVSTSDALMVMPRERAQDVKSIVGRLKELNRKEASEHRRGHRPWGYYEIIDAGERFQVKRIVVMPGGRLSLQTHMHRAEHWVIVRGTAEVTRGNDVKLFHENESVYVAVGTVHRLGNPGKIPLEVIEIQTGSYLGEDDISRIDDVYRRD
jgi:mannose-1-phosphate guanylyltransferase/mannose-6-phosphate isomerase